MPRSYIPAAATAVKPPKVSDTLSATPPGDDDATLVERCRSGDARAWEALIKRYQRLVRAIVMRTGLDEHTAGDVFQTVFTRLFQHLPKIADPSRLQAWIVTTAKREALHQRQLNRRTLSIDGDDEAAGAWELADDAPGPQALLDDLQQQHAVRLAMEQLDGRSRFLLTALFGDPDDARSYQEVADHLGIPVGSIGPTRSRCLDKLRRLMMAAGSPGAPSTR